MLSRLSFTFNQSLVEKIDEVIQPQGFECIELLITSDKTKSLKLYIDRIPTDGEAQTVSVDDCAVVSRLLDEQSWFEDVVQGAFRLEVSSPGVDRPLRFVRHFKRYIGETVKVQLKEKFQDRWKGTGTIQSVNEEDTLNLETELGEWSFPISAVQKANIIYQWGSS